MPGDVIPFAHAAATGVMTGLIWFVQVVHYPMLGFDLDTPEDLERLDPARLRELMDAGRTAVERASA